jgi:hypothetical protein
MTTQTSTSIGSSLLRPQFDAAHQLLEATMADVTTEQAHWMPPGIANPLGATYAHVVTAEDYIIQGMFKRVAPLAATEWAGKSGLSEPMPSPGPQWSEYPGWTRRVTLDLAALKVYAQAVYAATDAYVSGLTDADMARPFDLSPRPWPATRNVQDIASWLAGPVVALLALPGPEQPKVVEESLTPRGGSTRTDA